MAPQSNLENKLQYKNKQYQLDKPQYKNKPQYQFWEKPRVFLPPSAEPQYKKNMIFSNKKRVFTCGPGVNPG